MANENHLIIDGRDGDTYQTGLASSWRLVTDTVMGGLSKGALTMDNIENRPCLRLSGEVKLENNGGFIQAGLDLTSEEMFDAHDFTGIVLDLYGNDEAYNIHLRTHDLLFPWQSYRTSFIAKKEWRTFKFPFSDFQKHRTDKSFDTGKLKRVGLVAIGRKFYADICIGLIGFY